jgi:hypothetical protein
MIHDEVNAEDKYQLKFDSNKYWADAGASGWWLDDTVGSDADGTEAQPLAQMTMMMSKIQGIAWSCRLEAHTQYEH